MYKRHRLSNFFITIAPDDINLLSVFYITFKSNSNEEFPATLLDKAFNDFNNSWNILNKEEISIPASFHDKANVVMSNLFAATNECRRFLIGFLEFLLQLLLSQLGLCRRILKTIFARTD